MKPTKAQIRQELKATDAGRVLKRGWDEVASMIQLAIAVNRVQSSGVVAALLWSQGFSVDEAHLATRRLIDIVRGVEGVWSFPAAERLSG